MSREGTTYAQLLAQVQSERARNLLRNGALSVTEIASRLHFSHPAIIKIVKKNRTGAYIVDRISMKIPILGQIINKSTAATLTGIRKS